MLGTRLGLFWRNLPYLFALNVCLLLLFAFYRMIVVWLSLLACSCCGFIVYICFSKWHSMLSFIECVVIICIFLVICYMLYICHWISPWCSSPCMECWILKVFAICYCFSWMLLIVLVFLSVFMWGMIWCVSSLGIGFARLTCDCQWINLYVYGIWITCSLNVIEK